MGTSVVENLVFLLFTNTLGSSNFICGVSVVVTVVFEIPLFFYANSMLQYLGPVILLAISTLAYSIRVVGYTLVPASANWVVLFLEPLHGVTYGCLKIASVEFVSQTAPSGYDVSFQGILGALQNLGSLVGVSVGGYVEERLGSRVLYRGAAAVVTVCLALFIGVFSAEHRETNRRSRSSNSSSSSSSDSGRSFMPEKIVELIAASGGSHLPTSTGTYSKLQSVEEQEEEEAGSI